MGGVAAGKLFDLEAGESDVGAEMRRAADILRVVQRDQPGARREDRLVGRAARLAVEIAHQHHRVAGLPLRADPAADTLRALDPRHLSDMVEVRVDEDRKSVVQGEGGSVSRGYRWTLG